MGNRIKEKIKTLRGEIGAALRNRLVLPKTIMGLIRDGKATKNQILKMQEGLDESIRMVDAKFAEFLDGFKKE